MTRLLWQVMDMILLTTTSHGRDWDHSTNTSHGNVTTNEACDHGHAPTNTTSHGHSITGHVHGTPTNHDHGQSTHTSHGNANTSYGDGHAPTTASHCHVTTTNNYLVAT